MLKGQIIFDKTLEAQNRRMIIDLAGKLPKTGRCSLLLSGGDTPQSFYNALSQQNWPWEKITTALVDDRWVDPNNSASNENLVKQYLLINYAKKSPFFWYEILFKLAVASRSINKPDIPDPSKTIICHFRNGGRRAHSELVCGG